VLADNARMLALCDELGFERSRAEDGIIHVRLPLRAPAAGAPPTSQAAGRSRE